MLYTSQQVCFRFKSCGIHVWCNSSQLIFYSTTDTTLMSLCDKVCRWLVTDWLFSQGTPVSSTNKTDCHDVTEILLKVALNTIPLTPSHYSVIFYFVLLSVSWYYNTFTSTQSKSSPQYVQHSTIYLWHSYNRKHPRDVVAYCISIIENPSSPLRKLPPLKLSFWNQSPNLWILRDKVWSLCYTYHLTLSSAGFFTTIYLGDITTLIGYRMLASFDSPPSHRCNHSSGICLMMMSNKRYNSLTGWIAIPNFYKF